MAFCVVAGSDDLVVVALVVVAVDGVVPDLDVVDAVDVIDDDADVVVDVVDVVGVVVGVDRCC